MHGALLPGPRQFIEALRYCQMKLREWESGRTRHYLELNSSVNCYFYECVLYACDTTANKTGEATPLEWLSV